MDLQELFVALAQVSGLLFIITSMLAMGMSLTMDQIVQPLKNARLVILALVANFVLVPLLAYAITLVIPLEQSLAIGLIVLATAAGAPFLPKLVQGAKGDIPFGAGPRVCIGNNFAILETQLILAATAQRYCLELVPGRPVEMECGHRAVPGHDPDPLRASELGPR